MYRWGPLKLQDEPYAKRLVWDIKQVMWSGAYAPTTRYPTLREGADFLEGFHSTWGNRFRVAVEPESRPGSEKGSPGGSMGPGRQRVSEPRGPSLHTGSRRNSLCPRKEDEQNELFHSAAHSESWGWGALAQFTGSPGAQPFHARTQFPLCTYCSRGPSSFKKSLTLDSRTSHWRRAAQKEGRQGLLARGPSACSFHSCSQGFSNILCLAHSRAWLSTATSRSLPVLWGSVQEPPTPSRKPPSPSTRSPTAPLQG